MLARKAWKPLALGAACVALAAVAGLGAPLAPVPATGPEITVYKSPTCGCCRKWIDHLRAAGFQVTARDTSDMGAITARYGVPRSVTSCHTAVVQGYVIEGHVPADVIARLLRERPRPRVAGLAVPGMPAGSPGMESPTPARYDVLAFDRAGTTAVYATP